METFLRYLRLDLFTLSGTQVTPLTVLLFLFTLGVAATLGRLARQGITRVVLARGGTGQQGLAYALGKMVQYVILILGALVALDNVGLSLKSLAAIGGILAVGIGFGLQNIAQNFASGLILLIERPVQKGDFINVGDTAGTVEDIAMRATRLITRDGVQIIVPNSELISTRVVNRSAPTSSSRVRVSVGVAYGSQVEQVQQTLLAVAAASARVQREPAPYVFFRDFGDSALQFELAVWIDSPQLELRITSELRFAIDAAFRAAGISIPFPQREVRLLEPVQAASAPEKSG